MQFTHYTLHVALNTLHFTCYILHWTLHVKLYILNSMRYTFHFSLYTFDFKIKLSSIFLETTLKLPWASLGFPWNSVETLLKCPLNCSHWISLTFFNASWNVQPISGIFNWILHLIMVTTGMLNRNVSSVISDK